MWRCCRWPQFRSHDTSEKINILILGLNGSGKTEIGHIIAGKQRTDQSSTNGLRTFSRNLSSFVVTFTEIGGNEDIRNIWHHYYIKAHAVIYVVDLSDDNNMNQSYDILAEVIRHRYMQGKAILVLANKTDICEQPDILDFYERFPLESLANSYQSHILLQCCGHDDYTELFSGLDWLRYRIETDYHQLKNRIQFDIESRKMEEERQSGIRRLIGFTQRPNFLRRPRSAPTVPTTGKARAKAKGGSFTRNRRALRRNRVHSANAVAHDKP